ncbi:MAG: hypothetical protein DWI20_01285 [Planctomycetota bacterium]|nr:MAG: hypothetical protein DWI20_01285 [Planctomycetota bacterium]
MNRHERTKHSLLLLGRVRQARGVHRTLRQRCIPPLTGSLRTIDLSIEMHHLRNNRLGGGRITLAPRACKAQHRSDVQPTERNPVSKKLFHSSVQSLRVRSDGAASIDDPPLPAPMLLATQNDQRLLCGGVGRLLSLTDLC